MIGEPGVVENIVVEGNVRVGDFQINYGTDHAFCGIYSVNPITIKGSGKLYMPCEYGYAIIAESVTVDSQFTGTMDLVTEISLQNPEGVFRFGEGFLVQAYTDFDKTSYPYGAPIGDPVVLELPFSGNLSSYRKLVVTPVAD